MGNKKNIILLIFAIVFFIIAVMFFVWSFFGEHNTNINIGDVNDNFNLNMQNKVKQENIVNNEIINEEIDNSESKDISNTEDIENISYTDITIYNERNEEISLSEFADTSVMILFWNSQNGDSVEVLKKVNNLYEKYKEKVKFLMISTSKDIPETVKNGISMDIYYDLNNEYQEKYNVQKIPTIIYIYKDNSIMNAKSGIPSNDAIEANLDILSDNV